MPLQSDRTRLARFVELIGAEREKRGLTENRGLRVDAHGSLLFNDPWCLTHFTNH